METLKITSIQSPNADFFPRTVAEYLSERLGLPIDFVSDPPWSDRERMLDAGEVQAGWICGLPYVRKVARLQPQIELLAAPVMRAPRYQNHPVYFSDVTVHRDSPFRSFLDLRGASWAYNEPNSHSGYNLTCYQLAKMGENGEFFGEVIAAGAHLTALDLILARRVDASAIDSTVLELAIAEDPRIARSIRTVATWGPSPIPPWVVRVDVDTGLRTALREALLSMHRDPRASDLLARAQVARFVAVTDADYDPIREMARLAERVSL